MEFDKLISPENLTYENIRVHYGTGRFMRSPGSKDKNDGHYRTGMMTNCGDIEQAQWITIAENVIRLKGDWELFMKLKLWYKENVHFLHTEKALHIYALDCFVEQVHNNPDWVDYEAFNKQHRPERLNCST